MEIRAQEQCLRLRWRLFALLDRTLAVTTTLLLCAIPIAAQSHKVPFALKDGKILIQARVNGQPALLKLDSGSTSTVFDAKFLKAPVSTKKVEVRTAGGMAEASRGDARCEIGDLAFVLPQTVYLPNFAGKGLIDSEGVVGLDVLSKFQRVVIDFANSEIDLEGLSDAAN